MNKLNKVKKVLNQRRKNIHEHWYHSFYKKGKICKNTMLLESTHGKTFNSHLYYIAEYITKNNKDLSVHIVSRDPEKLDELLKEKGFSNYRIVKHLSKEYCRLLATSEYLINDTTFWPFFNKKEGQKYFNIWHGTPLKTLGKDMEVLVDVANVQRNFYMADKIIVSNEYTKDILVSSHNLTGIYTGKIVIAPSPRNAILFDIKASMEIREQFAPNNEQIIIYMPTWRGSVGKVNKDEGKLIEDLKYLSSKLNKNQKIFVKLHPFQKVYNINNIPNIYPFPENVELYEFLSGVDVLVTDYSSIMYDFLNTNKKVILYAYDKEEYYQTRGTYEDIENYAFPIVAKCDDLIKEINQVQPVNYKTMIKKYCAVDNLDGVKQVVEFVLNGRIDERIEEFSIHNGKETVAILSGGFWDNGITTALLNTLEKIDTSKRNYIVFFGRNKLKFKHYFRVKNLPENILFYPVPGHINASIFERFLNKRYMFNENFKGHFIAKKVGKLYEYEFKRIFGSLKIDHFIHYTGFERKYAEMIKHIDKKTKTYIFVHTDMFKEYEAKKNYIKKIIFGAYKAADHVVLVNENLKENFVNTLPYTKDKIKIMNNFLGEDKVGKLSNENLINTLVDVEIDFGYSETFRADVEKQLMNRRDKRIEMKDNYVKDIIDTIKEGTGLDSNSGLLTKINSSVLESLDLEIDKLSEITYLENELSIKEGWAQTFSNELDMGLSVYKKRSLISQYSEVLKERLENDVIKSLLPNIENNMELFDVLKDYSENQDIHDADSVDFDSLLTNLSLDKLRLIEKLLNEETISFINIGRYDHQKGHERLIESFERVNITNPNTCLIIVAPHGPLKRQTIDRVNSSFSKESIFILGRMSNPYGLLKYSNAFVLSSFYEGLGLVAYEALGVGTDLITVNLPETIKYLEEDNAIIVDNSTEGLYLGMKTYLDKENEFKTFNFEKQNVISIQEFEDLFKN